MPKPIALIGAFDSKGAEFAFVRDRIHARGHATLTIDCGVLGEPTFTPDIPAARVAAAGGTPLDALRAQADRGAAMAVMTRGAAAVVQQLYADGQIAGVLGMGGSAGTVIASAAMRALPVGVPKVLVSTLASADTGPYVGTSDIVMLHSVVDVAGINSISARIFANAVGAIVGMVETQPPQLAHRPLIAASMFGNTTQLVDQCRALLEAQGYEVLVFHATGSGGRTLEALVADGYVAGALDVTTTEWADELLGGVLSAGPTRLDAAAAAGVPQVIAPGCLDMVNFWARSSVPAKYANRLFYEWNPNVTLMRTNVAESAELGRILAEKANRASAPVAFFLPLRGLSLLDAPGGLFWWPEADRALFDAIRRHARADIPVVELDCNINDAPFAEAVTAQLVAFLTAAGTR